MKKILLIHALTLFIMVHVTAQVEPTAGNWKTWFITSGKEYRLPSPPSNSKDEFAQIISAQSKLDAAGIQNIAFYNAGPPGYRWYNMVSKLWMTDISGNGALAQMLIGTTIY